MSSVLGSATLRMHVYVINKLALSIGNFIGSTDVIIICHTLYIYLMIIGDITEQGLQRKKRKLMETQEISCDESGTQTAKELIHIDVLMLCSKFELIPTSIFRVTTI